MARFTPLKLVATALAVAVLRAGLDAQSTPAPSPILAPAANEQAPAPAPKRTRAVSSEVAAALAAATPKYTPAPPKPAPKPEEELPDLRDLDKPKNAIVRLPKYIVREAKPPVFSERSILTEKGLTDVAMRRYISDVDRALNLASLPFLSKLSEARALAMYGEDERLQNMADLSDAARNVSKSDPAGGEYILRESQRTYKRTGDFGWGSSGSKGWTAETADAIRAESARRK